MSRRNTDQAVTANVLNRLFQSLTIPGLLNCPHNTNRVHRYLKDNTVHPWKHKHTQRGSTSEPIASAGDRAATTGQDIIEDIKTRILTEPGTHVQISADTRGFFAELLKEGHCFNALRLGDEIYIIDVYKGWEPRGRLKQGLYERDRYLSTFMNYEYSQAQPIKEELLDEIQQKIDAARTAENMNSHSLFARAITTETATNTPQSAPGELTPNGAKSRPPVPPIRR